MHCLTCPWWHAEEGHGVMKLDSPLTWNAGMPPRFQGLTEDFAEAQVLFDRQVFCACLTIDA